ncbi:MAG: biotin transporter BioY [Bacillota bacterium]
MRLKLKQILLVAIFLLLTAIGALITLPLAMEWINLQVLFALLAGSLLGPWLGALSQVLYLVIGVLGLPIYTGGEAGIAYLIGPHGGFLLALPIAAYIVGRLLTRYESIDFIITLLVMSSGLLVIYTLEIMSLSVARNLEIKEVIVSVIAPYLIPDIIKVIIGSYFTVRLKGAD